MTMLGLLQAQPVLRKIASQEMPLSVTYKLSKLFSRLEQELKFFYQERRKLVSEYTDNIDGKITPRDGVESIYFQKSADLLNLEIDFNEFQPIQIPASLDIMLSCNEIELIENFITITED